MRSSPRTGAWLASFIPTSTHRLTPTPNSSKFKKLTKCFQTIVAEKLTIRSSGSKSKWTIKGAGLNGSGPKRSKKQRSCGDGQKSE